MRVLGTGADGLTVTRFPNDDQAVLFEDESVARSAVERRLLEIDPHDCLATHCQPWAPCADPPEQG